MEALVLKCVINLDTLKTFVGRFMENQQIGSLDSHQKAKAT
jgi:hypothetical protein